MPNLLIRDVPKNVYNLLKENAAKHHRSLGKEALVFLEMNLWSEPLPRLDWSRAPKPIKLKGSVDFSPEALNAAIDEGQR